MLRAPHVLCGCCVDRKAAHFHGGDGPPICFQKNSSIDPGDVKPAATGAGKSLRHQATPCWTWPANACFTSYSTSLARMRANLRAALAMSIGPLARSCAMMDRFIKKLGEVQRRFPCGVEFRILVQQRSLLLTVISKDADGHDTIGAVRAMDRERAESAENDEVVRAFEQMASALDASLAVGAR
jgi:hypothetical protein